MGNDDDKTQDQNRQEADKIKENAKNLTEKLKERGSDIEESQVKEIKELRRIMPDKEWHLKESLKKLEKSNDPKDSEKLRKDVGEKAERLKNVGEGLLSEIEKAEKRGEV